MHPYLHIVGIEPKVDSYVFTSRKLTERTWHPNSCIAFILCELSRRNFGSMTFRPAVLPKQVRRDYYFYQRLANSRLYVDIHSVWFLLVHWLLTIFSRLRTNKFKSIDIFIPEGSKIISYRIIKQTYEILNSARHQRTESAGLSIWYRV